MGLVDFKRVWGESGNHLWNKFLDYDKNPAEFICYLDGGNMGLLMKEFEQHLGKIKARTGGAL